MKKGLTMIFSDKSKKKEETLSAETDVAVLEKPSRFVKDTAEDKQGLSAEAKERKKLNIQEDINDVGAYQDEKLGGETYKEWAERQKKEKAIGQGKTLAEKRLEEEKIEKDLENFKNFRAESQDLPDDVRQQQVEELAGLLNVPVQQSGMPLGGTPVNNVPGTPVNAAPASTDMDKWLKQKIESAETPDVAEGLKTIRNFFASSAEKMSKEDQSTFFKYLENGKDGSDEAPYQAATRFFTQKTGIEIPAAAAEQATVAVQKLAQKNDPKNEPKLEPGAPAPV